MASSSDSSSSNPPADTSETDSNDGSCNGLSDAAIAVSVVGGGVLAIKALVAVAAASVTLSVSLLPLAYVYGLQTRPPKSSFDAKTELRSVLKGDALPEDHPSKPKAGSLSGLWKGAVATLQSELVALSGYTLSIENSFGGAAWTATVTLPSSDLKCTWIGCNRQWYYRGATKLSAENTNAPGREKQE